MHAGEIFLIIILNCILIFILYLFQKRLIEKNIKNLKNEIRELEDLVAAIIEEFEDIAENPGNKDKPVENHGQFEEFAGMSPQELKLNYPTVGDFLDNMEENELQEMVRVEAPRVPFNEENPMREPVNINTESLTENDEEVGETGEEVGKSQTLTTNSNESEAGEPGIVSIEESPGGSVSKPGTGLQLESINDPRHRRILELREQGITIEDIARQLGTGRGEIQLVLGLYRRS